MPDGETYEEISNLSQSTFLAYVERYDEIVERGDAAKGQVRAVVRERKELRIEMKGAGINLGAFDRFRRDIQKAGTVRDEEDVAHRQYMAWLKMPIGYQAVIKWEEPEISDRDVRRAQGEGREAGRTGEPRDSNRYSPSTDLFHEWDSEWQVGNAERERVHGEAAPKRRPGRPRRDADAEAHAP